ncbi:MAG: hypothetical protein DMF28_06795 [Verrucomicrobia bacterium]|nr:MAG: hypothetical protein DMF28_06795 [Verrucomicrobiota bacterium]
MEPAAENSGARKIVITLVVLTTVCVLSLIVGGVTSLISLADRIHPVAGSVVFWTIVLAAGFFAFYCVIAYARLPAALIPSAETSGPKHEAYLQALRARLAANPRTRDLPLVTLAEIEAAVGQLSNEADKVVRRTASTVFLSTALMQNGRLDGLVVLFTQIQMVNRVARVYVQRPSPRELMRLYANVAGTALIAGGLESLDLGEMIAPLATSVVPALKGGIPGLSGISALLVRCISNGAANAFLTLRVGEVARRYCALTSRCSPDAIRKSATAAAVHHLGRIVRENGALVVRKIWEAARDSGVSKVEDIRGATRDLFTRISPWRHREEDPAHAQLGE